MKCLLSFAALLIFTGCGSNRINRLSSAGQCNPDENLASFELLENEGGVFELVPGGLPTDSEFETTGFTLTKIENKIISTFSPIGFFSDEPRLSIVCADGFVVNEPASGSFDFSVAVLNLKQELHQHDYFIDFSTQNTPIFNTNALPVLTPLGGVDILDAMISLGYEVNLYTFKKGNQRNVVFIIHARDLSKNLTLRLRLQKIG